MKNAKYECYMFLAFEKTSKEILTVYCKLLKESHNEIRKKEESRQIIMDQLHENKKDKSYDLKYLGIIYYEDFDKELKDIEDQIFEKYGDVWISKTSLSI